MKEFWSWALIVTLIIFCIMALSFAIVHTNAQIKKAEVILQRAEQFEKDKKREKTRRDPVDPE